MIFYGTFPFIIIILLYADGWIDADVGRRAYKRRYSVLEKR